MIKHSKLPDNVTFIWAILSGGFLLFIMLAIQVYKQQIFFEQDILSDVEIVILIGFGLVLLFNAVSFLWGLLRIRQSEKVSIGYIATPVLSILCLVLLFGDKVMTDEIAREYKLGWEVLGEWIILYVFLSVQLFYNVFVFLQLFKRRKQWITLINAD